MNNREIVVYRKNVEAAARLIQTNYRALLIGFVNTIGCPVRLRDGWGKLHEYRPDLCLQGPIKFERRRKTKHRSFRGV